ncbi:MAG: GNAT family N-acetyltransferase [Anaerolineae bacterium]|nr:GNAT family N-acetyltransferase [Anaerolineae bacterium]
MSDLTSRPYAGESDRALLHAVIGARPAARRGDFPSLADLAEMLSVPEVADNIQLWLDAGGQPLGFAIVEPRYDNLYFDVVPAAGFAAVGAAMVAWGVERQRQLKQGEASLITLDTDCREDDTTRRALLDRLGFVPLPQVTVSMVRPLDRPVADPILPPGYTLRSVSGPEEDAAWVRLHRTAWQTGHMTLEERRAMTAEPGYDRALDLVITAPDGALAAYCVGAIYAGENALTGQRVGYLDPVATHPAHQRRGLARALLCVGLQRLQERGMAAARLGTTGGNTAMLKAAEAVGFTVEARKFWLQKALDS